MFPEMLQFYDCYVHLLHSLRSQAARDHSPPAALLNVSAHRVFGHPVLFFPILTTTLMYISVADFILSRGEVLLLN